MTSPTLIAQQLPVPQQQSEEITKDAPANQAKNEQEQVPPEYQKKLIDLITTLKDS